MDSSGCGTIGRPSNHRIAGPGCTVEKKIRKKRAKPSSLPAKAADRPVAEATGEAKAAPLVDALPEQREQSTTERSLESMEVETVAEGTGAAN